jgi:hypothetical protein
VSGPKSKLWKGRRESELELLVIDEAALKLAKGRWELFSHSIRSSRELRAMVPAASHVVDEHLMRELRWSGLRTP